MWFSSYSRDTEFSFAVEAMKRIEEIKERRQAQHIYDRWKKAKEIERQKDVKEVSE